MINSNLCAALGGDTACEYDPINFHCKTAGANLACDVPGLNKKACSENTGTN